MKHCREENVRQMPFDLSFAQDYPILDRNNVE